MSFRCFVLDDEPLARTSVEVELARHPAFELARSDGDPRRALEAAVDDPPDLLFLDVRMPGLDGMAFLERLRERVPAAARPYVVLVTAFDRYALTAFEYEALDYLVKPFDSARFAETLRRAEERLRQRRAARARGAEDLPGGERLRVPVSRGELFLAPDELRWVESADHYLLLHVAERTHLVRETMARMAERLEPHGFVRVHRGALVHPRHVRRCEVLGDGARRLHLSEGSRVRVSRRRWHAVRDRLRPA